MGILRRFREWREDKDGVLTGPDIKAESVDTEQIATDYLYAGAFDGADPDARLDNVLSAAASDDAIYLEGDNYTEDRTISKDVRIVAPGAGSGGASNGRIDGATWTLTDRSRIENISAANNGEIVCDAAFFNSVIGGTGAIITVNGNRARIIGGANLDVTFANGTSSGVADSLVNSSVTDNGSNTVGDLG